MAATPALLNSTSTGPSTASITASTPAGSDRSASTKRACGPSGALRSSDGHLGRAHLGQQVEQGGADARGAAGDHDVPAGIAERVGHGFSPSVVVAPSDRAADASRGRRRPPP